MSDTAAAADLQQQATRVFAIRHGETAWNAESRIQGQLDIPLNARGRWQAERLASALADEGIDAIYASDLQRAHATAASLAAVCGRRIVGNSGLRERAFGAFQGCTFDEIAARWPAQSARWRRREPAFEPEGGGESLEAFYARAVGTAARLAAAHRGQTIALVAHGGVLDCLYRAATGLELQAPRTWQIGNAGINRLLHTGQRFTLVGWADMSHLDQPVANTGG